MKSKQILITIGLVIIGLLAYITFKVEHNENTKNPQAENVVQNSNTPNNNPSSQESTPSTDLPSPFITAKENWPPVIKHADVLYECKESKTEMGTTQEKIIGSRTYCVSLTTDGGAGNFYDTYNYETASLGGSGVDTANFVLHHVNCGVYSEPEMGQCQEAQTKFFNSLDQIVDSLMK